MPNDLFCPTDLPQDPFPPRRTSIPADWSARIQPDVSLQDLDPEAMALARERYKTAHPEAAVDGLSDAAFLADLGLLRDGGITNAALVLLRNSESAYYLGGSHAILWRLHYGNGAMRAYETFHPPFLTAMDQALDKIRLLPYRYLADPSTLLPEVAIQYDTRVLRELMANAIAHSNYINMSGRV